MQVRRPPATLSIPTVPIAVALVVVVLGGCSSGSDDVSTSTSTSPTPTVTASATSGDAANDDLDFPDVVSVEADGAAGTWTFAVTISSPYDTPEQYADGWRVVGPDGTVYGVHTLTHDHAAEQPFTRTQSGVEIPDSVSEVTIEGRDLVNGFGGGSATVPLVRN